jgi:hypothetical protein
MKTKIFIAAALLVTGTAFSQSVSSRNEATSRASASTSSTPGNASADGSLSSSSSTSSNVNAAGKVEAASQVASGVKQSGEASLAATKKEVKKDYKQVRQEAEANDRISAGVHAGSNGNVETQHNKAGSNASINTANGVSASSTLGSGTIKMTKSEVKAKNATDVHINSVNRVKPKPKATGSTQVNTGAKVSANGGAKHAGMKTGIKSNISGRSGISIK